MPKRKIKLAGSEKILLVRPDRLGDLILSLPVASTLKKIYPKTVIHFLASHYNAQVLKYSPDVDGCILLTEPDGKPLKAEKLIEILEVESYAVALFLKPSWLSAFAAYMAGIQVRVGTWRRPYSLLFNIRENIKRKHSGMHEVDLNLMMLRPFGIDVELGTVTPFLKAGFVDGEDDVGLGVDNNYMVIHPFSKGSAPNWPIQSYLHLADMLSQKITVVVTGQYSFPLDMSDRICNLINKTSFTQLVGVISRAKLFISGSTGPLHLATALGTPVMALYPNHPYLGPQRWGPCGENAVVLTPGKQNGQKYRNKDNGDSDCMKSIEVNAVFEKACRMLSNGAMSV